MNPRLKLENQLCFPLYAAAKEVVRRYRPLLEPYGLTYTQYICLMVLWEHHSQSVSQLGEKLFLDSGTLTPMLKKMECSGLIRRMRSDIDERQVIIELTTHGLNLHDLLAHVPAQMSGCVKLDPEELMELYRLLHKFLQSLR